MSLNPFAQQFNKPPQQTRRPPTQEQPQTTSQSPLNVIRTFIRHANQPWRNILSHALYAEITPYSTTYYVPVPGVGIVGVNDTGLITSVNGIPIGGPGSNSAYFFNALMSAYAPPVPAPPPAPPRPQPTQAPPRPTQPIEVLPATPSPPPVPPPTTQQQPPRFIEELLTAHPPTAPQPPPSIEVMLPLLTPPRRVAGLALW
jgi:hypothetical protein